MYRSAIAEAQQTFDANKRVRSHAASLCDDAKLLLLRFRRHRLLYISGGTDADDHRCTVCRHAIKDGEGRYRIGESEYHPDCFRFWLTAPLARTDDAVD